MTRLCVFFDRDFLRRSVFLESFLAESFVFGSFPEEMSLNFQANTVAGVSIWRSRGVFASQLGTVSIYG
jgi:hypothetical protein